jgi:hypothetical protein
MKVSSQSHFEPVSGLSSLLRRVATGNLTQVNQYEATHFNDGENLVS